jgi:CTP synthase
VIIAPIYGHVSGTGLLLKATGMKVSSIRIDPDLDVNMITMSPKEYGEVLVLDDSGEVNLHLSN